MKVSIIIPVYNVEKYLSRCLDSVLGQTHKDIEAILVNDYGSDNSWDIAHDYARRDPRIVLVNSDCNHGTMIARHCGIKVATGDFMMFVDSDDYLPLDAVESLCNKIGEKPVDIVAGRICRVPQDESSTSFQNRLPYGSDKNSFYKALLDSSMCHNLAGKIFSRKLFDDHTYNVFEKMSNGEDACMLYQIVEHINCAETIDSCVYCYWVNTDSSMHRKFTLKQVESIVQSNAIRHDIRKRHPALDKDFFHTIGISLLRLYTHDLPQKIISKKIREARLEEYIQTSNIAKLLYSLSLLDLLRFIKAYLSK